MVSRGEIKFSGGTFDSIKDDSFIRSRNDDDLKKTSYFENASMAMFESFEEMAKTMKDLTEDGGVKKAVLREGEGELVSDTDIIKIHYTGYVENSDEPFDSTYLKNSPFKLKLCEKRLVLGFQIGIRTMRLREVARFLITKDYFLQDTNTEPYIPNESTAMFEVEILSTSPSNVHEDYFSMEESERLQLPKEEVYKLVEVERSRAKEYFTSEKYIKAIEKYKYCHQIITEHPLKNDEDPHVYHKIRLSILNNIALSNFKLGNLSNCIKYSNKTLEFDPDNIRALVRKATCAMRMTDFKLAKELLLKAYKIDPKCEDVKKHICTCELYINDADRAHREFCQKMLGPNKITSSSLVGSINEAFRKMVQDNIKFFTEKPNMPSITYQLVCPTEKEVQYFELCALEAGFGFKKFLDDSDISVTMLRND